MLKQGLIVLLVSLLCTACSVFNAEKKSGASGVQNIKETAFFQTEQGHDILSDQVAVASAHPLATEAGLRVLENGGNAFDAAVAVSAALAVVEPAGSGLGGGGFWLLHRASDGKQVMIDGREQAPKAASRDMYLDADGNVVKGASTQGPLAAGIPGLPAALVHITDKYGALSLEDNLQPAYEYARDGFEISPRLQKFLGWRQACFNEEAKSVFLSDAVNQTQRIKQTDLAAVIERLSEQGLAGFYQGETAKRLVDDVQTNGGIWTLGDLADYRVLEREPIRFKYRDARIVSATLPSSGGLVMQQTLQMIERRQAEPQPSLNHHLVVEAMRRAYRDRALFMGDSDFVSVDKAALTTKEYIDSLASGINLEQSTPSKELAAASQLILETKGEDTTHFSIVDAQGNRVAATLSINFPFGSCFMPKGTGIFLNNEMDDFSIKPGEPNGYGLIGVEANAIAPGKRPLSSMSPTFIEQPNQVTVIGTPGGSRIISMVILATLATVDMQLPLQQVVDLPRFHHQFWPDAIQHEPRALADEVSKQLELKGHVLKQINREYGDMHAVQWSKQDGVISLDAASDRRGEGAAQVISTGP